MQRFFALFLLCSICFWDAPSIWGANSHRLSERYERGRVDTPTLQSAIPEHSRPWQVSLTLDETYSPAPPTAETRAPDQEETGVAEPTPAPDRKQRKPSLSFLQGIADRLAALHDGMPLLYPGLMASLLVLLLVGVNIYLKFRMKRAIRRLPWASLRQDSRIQAWPSQKFIRKLRLWDYLKDGPALEKLREQRREEMKAKRKRKPAPMLLRKYYTRLGEIKTPEEGLYVLKVMTLVANVKVIGPILDLLDLFPEDREIRKHVVLVLRSIRDARLLRVILPYLPKADPELEGILVETCRSFGETGGAILVRELERVKDPAIQQGVIKLLGAMGGTNIVSVLSSLLLDGSDAQRLAAAGALASMGTEETVQPLVNGLCKNTSAEVREEIRKGLGKIPEAPTVALLTQIVETSPTFYFRTRALEGLEAICSEPGDAFYKALEDDHPKVQAAAATALSRMGAIESTLDAYTKDFDDRQQTFLVTVGKAGAMEPFLSFLQTDDMKALKRVVRLLAMIGNREVVPRLMHMLERTEDWTVQSRIIPALAVLQATEAVPHILKHLKSTHHWVRKTAIDALGTLVTPVSDLRDQTLDLLHRALGDEDPWTRASAARVLAELEDRTSTPLLINLLDDAQT
ncbi:MAG: HEAT repeat domain-containing protein, partial [bacterium]|nr:HEAT repeat domain-containing protein [bacterium]